MDVQVYAHLGQPMRITVKDAEGNTGIGATDFIVETARKHALDEAAIRKQVDRLGNTEFSLSSLTLDIEPNIMVPMSEINEARRKAVEALTKQRLDTFLPPRKKRFGRIPYCNSGAITACVNTRNWQST